MLISEQKLANLGRIYYRGLRSINPSEKRYTKTYLTTRFVYALVYATRNGIIEQCCLKSTANIFNMKYKTASLSGKALFQNPAFKKAREQEMSYIMSSGYNYEFDDIRSRIVTLSGTELRDLLLRAGRKENIRAQNKKKQNILKEWNEWNERLGRA